MEGREWCGLAAYAWLRGRCEHDGKRVMSSGRIFELDSGEAVLSVREAAETWGWSKTQAHRFIAHLEDKGLINRRSARGSEVDLERKDRQSLERKKPGGSGRFPTIVTAYETATYREAPEDSGTKGNGQSGTKESVEPGTKGSPYTNGDNREKRGDNRKGTPRKSSKKNIKRARERSREEPITRERFNKLRGETAKLIREHLWLGKNPPGDGWNMKRDLDIWTTLVKRYDFDPVELNGAIEVVRDTLPYLEDDPATMRVLYQKKRPHDLKEAIHTWRKRQRSRPQERAVHDGASIADAVRRDR